MKIAVLGAGLMGRVLSMRLYQDGYTNLTLIDRDNRLGKKSPAFIAAGMLSPFSESVMGGSLIYKLGKQSLLLWQKYLASINATAWCNARGALLLAEPNFIAEIRHYITKINFNLQKTDYYQLLDRSAIFQLEPELSFNQAYFLPGEGALNAREVMLSLGNYLLPRINWHSESEISCTKPGSSIVVNGNKYSFDVVIDCRGLGSRELQPNLRGIRGEVIRVYAPDVAISRPVRLFHPRHNIYISPYAINHYVIGATEIEAEDFSPVSVKSALELLSSAYIIHSGFAEARILEMGTNCRPTLANNLPQIVAQDNFISINGLYRHGFLLAPSLAEEVITYLTNKTKQYSEIWS
jgi:glycine oxidase